MKIKSLSSVLAALAAFAMIAMTAVSCHKDKGGDDSTVAVTGVTLDKTSATINVGETVTLKATVTPENATNKKVSWKTDDSSVASVDNGGTVTGNSAGTVKIFVYTEDGDKAASCTVTVKKKVSEVSVTGIKLDKTSLTLTEGESATLKVTISPENATNKKVSWKSSDDKVASVDADGKVTAVAAGDAKITVTTEDGGKIAICQVKVEKKVEEVKVTGVKLDKNEATMKAGETITLVATVQPENATNKEVAWKSTNTAVLSTDGGKITALKEGKATIKVTTEDGGFTDECVITVKGSTKAASVETEYRLFDTNVLLNSVWF